MDNLKKANHARRTKDIIEALQGYKNHNGNTSQLVPCLTEYLIEFFQRLDNDRERKWGDDYDAGAYLSTFLLRAAMLFEESDAEWVKKHRKICEDFWKGKTIGAGIFARKFDMESILLKEDLKTIMEEALPEQRYANYAILDGVGLAIMVYFNRFIEQIYIGKGMHDAIMHMKMKGAGGTFGSTKLLTFDCAGRIMLTFSRDTQQISFIKASEDKLALGAGVQSCNTDLITALTMIEDVTNNYAPEDFKEDPDVNLA